MADIQPGDVVARKSYDGDVVFRVKAIYENKDGKIIAIIKGIDIRLIADAPLEDLLVVTELDYHRYRRDNLQQDKSKAKSVLAKRIAGLNRKHWRANSPVVLGEEYFAIPGRVLHLDGDEEYLKKCLSAYGRLGIPHEGFCVPEKEQSKVINHYLQKHQPNILVITGHDGLLRDSQDFKDLNSYRNSKYFIETVQVARSTIPSRDDLVIFAGACQSYYEGLLTAGANFASSPRRVFIHIFDPVYIVEKVAYTSIRETLTINDVLANTVSGPEGVGGVETRGCFRWGYPKSPY